MPDFSCNMDEISFRMSIHSSPILGLLGAAMLTFLQDSVLHSVQGNFSVIS